MLRAEGIRHAYPGVVLFDGLELRLEPGEVRVVLGPSGSGKTTLIHLLAGILRVQEGRLYWGEVEVTRLEEERLARLRRRYVGLVFQHHYLLPELTALENAVLPGLLAGQPDWDWGRALLERVGLGARLHRRPAALSGGERQRVAVARAVYNRPRLLLADEPTGALDRENAQRVHALLLELAREVKSAVLIVTHDESLVRGMPAYRLEQGRLRSVLTSS